MPAILILDDERLFCDLLAAVLTDAGHEVVTTYAAAEAIRSFRERRPTVTVVDLRLGEESGLDVLKELRHIDPNARLIAITASSAPELEEQARALGIDDFLSKDLDIGTAVQLVGDTILSSSEHAASNDRAKRRPTHILVADDDPTVRQMLCKFLGRQPDGYRVSVAVNGREAMDAIMRDRPDLVLLDLRMPGLSGVECLRRLAKEAPAVGVIAMSGAHDEELVRNALELGSFDFFAKPLDFDRLAASIRAKLALMEGRRTRSWS